MFRSLQGRESFGPNRQFVAHSDKYRDILEKALQSRNRSASECYSNVNRYEPYRKPATFKKLKTLGQGAHSSVFLAQESSTNALYALKVISRETMRQHSQLLQEQIRILSRLRHQNIIQLYHIFMDECGLNLVLQYGEESLFSYVRRKGKLTEAEAARIISQILSAVDYIHFIGITHRDLKLENILLVNGVVKLCDFGFAKQRKIFDSSSQLLGTMGYLSPEIVASAHYTHKTDIWAAGVILSEMVQGRSFLDKMSDKQKYLYLKNVTNLLKQFSPSELKLNGSPELQCFLRRMFNWQELRPQAHQLLRDPFLRVHAD